MHLLLFGCSLISKSNRRAVSSLVKPSKMHQIPSKNIKIYLFLSVLVDFTRLCSALRYRRATEEQPKSSKNIVFLPKNKVHVSLQPHSEGFSAEGLYLSMKFQKSLRVSECGLRLIAAPSESIESNLELDLE